MKHKATTFYRLIYPFSLLLPAYYLSQFSFWILALYLAICVLALRHSIYTIEFKNELIHMTTFFTHKTFSKPELSSYSKEGDLPFHQIKLTFSDESKYRLFRPENFDVFEQEILSILSNNSPEPK